VLKQQAFSILSQHIKSSSQLDCIAPVSPFGKPMAIRFDDIMHLSASNLKYAFVFCQHKLILVKND